MANIYIDESGSINNHSKYAKDFVIALVVAKNPNALRRAYKRFVSKNLEELRELDSAASLKGKSRMFQNNRFKELKGSCFDREMKVRFVDFITRKNYFDLFLIKVDNTLLTDEFCKNTARAFNFIVKIALESFIKMGLLANEDHLLNLDERNERTDTKFFLQEYFLILQFLLLP